MTEFDMCCCTKHSTNEYMKYLFDHFLSQALQNMKTTLLNYYTNNDLITSLFNNTCSYSPWTQKMFIILVLND